MLQFSPQPFSKMDTAIALLQRLGAEAIDDGEPCARILFMAADYLQDMLDCPAEMGGCDADDEAEDGEALQAMMAGLDKLLPEPGLVVHL
ncbi:hypothetical protein [Teichococcus vastitatis]|jgi:hypothetical protein|uniref:Uncharacterized protein n=1 Tax=Teichococcus vastitatis TaxID=2307076 RepID=A0ABS9W086_9PROT|nr:hypothetical protein [Pseudoroseomonas vastitatis]MCI0752597.1 hypothetical protein [Pseudoroseomonas vastitatis]